MMDFRNEVQASKGVRGMLPGLGNFLDFNSLKSPFLVFFFLVIQTGY